MKKSAVLLIVLAVILAGCGQKAQKLGPGDMLDNDTGAVYHLGDPEDVFDSAFGRGVADGDSTKYLSKALTVEYDAEGRAVRIQADGGTNRFSFLGFDFSKSLADVKGRYELTSSTGFDCYSMCYSTDGGQLTAAEAFRLPEYVEHVLLVRSTDQAAMGLKAGDFVYYSIETRQGYAAP